MKFCYQDFESSNSNELFWISFSDISVDLGQIEQEFGYKYIELQLVSIGAPENNNKNNFTHACIC